MWNPVVTRQLRKAVCTHGDWGSATPEKDSPVLKPLDVGHAGQTHAPWPDSTLEDLGSKWPHGAFRPFRRGDKGSWGCLIRIPVYLLKDRLPQCWTKQGINTSPAEWSVTVYLEGDFLWPVLGFIGSNFPRENGKVAHQPIQSEPHSSPLYGKGGWACRGANHVQQICEGLKDLRIMMVGNLGTH